MANNISMAYLYFYTMCMLQQMDTVSWAMEFAEVVIHMPLKTASRIVKNGAITSTNVLGSPGILPQKVADCTRRPLHLQPITRGNGLSHTNATLKA